MAPSQLQELLCLSLEHVELHPETLKANSLKGKSG